MKQGIWVIWVGAAAAILLGGGWVSIAGHITFWGMLAAHVAEFVVKRPAMEAAGGSMTHHFLQTLIYGFLHWKPLEDQARSTEAA